MNSVMGPNLLHVLLEKAPLLDFILLVLELDDEKQRLRAMWTTALRDGERLERASRLRANRLSGPTG